MEGKNVEISLPTIREQVIWIFFRRISSHYGTIGVFGRCRTCSEDILIQKEKNRLQEHLKLHPVKWDLYLTKLAHVIEQDIPSPSVLDALKLATLVVDFETDREYSLKMPLSRVSREDSYPNITEVLTEFEGRVQKEYNSNPVGPYSGSYDQNEALNLNIQLPESSLDFNGYTQFRHPDNVLCKVYTIKESYNEFDDLKKIDALEIDEDGNLEVDDYDEDYETGLIYTCQKESCRVACPCSPCSGENQCSEHRLKHEEMFDEHLDAISIRSTEKYCNDKSFFQKSYVIKYPGIPIICKKCKKDVLHHDSYHLDFHDNCKFCRKHRFKTYAETAHELQSAVKKHADYLKSVCPHCDSKFCEPHFRKKHIEYEHGEAPFTCDYCTTKFHSKQAKEYHEAVHHLPAGQKEKCPICQKEFHAKVTLNKHLKYVHSEEKKHSCVICETKFKRKSDMRIHVQYVHGFNMSKAMYGNFEDEEEFKCDKCDLSFKYKKGLNEHRRMKHELGTDKHFQCDDCPSQFKQKKSLDEHKRLKHTDEKPQFPCPDCDKVFNQKNNMKRHQKTHK